MLKKKKKAYNKMCKRCNRRRNSHKRRHRQCCHVKQNKCEQTEKCQSPPTDEVYTMDALTIQTANAPPGQRTDDLLPDDFILHTIEDVDYPIQPQANNTIFAYAVNDQDEFTNVNAEGEPIPEYIVGPLYKKDFTQVPMRFHAQNQVNARQGNLVSFKESGEQVVDYSTSRGFPVPGLDSVSPMSDSFNWTSFNFDFGPNEDNKLVNIRMHYGDENSPIPTDLDLVALNFLLNNIGPSDWESGQQINRDRRFAYPVRIPITTDRKKFKCKCKCKLPIVYYDKITKELDIRAPELDHVSFKHDSYFVGFPEETSLAKFTMKGFVGKYQFVTRSSNNELVPSVPQEAVGLLQICEKIKVKCKYLIESEGPEIDTSYDIMYTSVVNGKYCGGVATKFVNGPRVHTYIYSPDDLGAYERPLEPFVRFGPDVGTNTSTLVPTHYSAATKYVAIDSSIWTFAIRYLGADFFNNAPLPEQFATYPVPSDPASDILTSSVFAHEWTHVCQGNGGLFPFVDVEGQAQAVEVNLGGRIQGTIITVRPRDLTQYYLKQLRGYQLLAAEDEDLDITFFRGTYGAAMWYTWLSYQLDRDLQSLRRANDLMVYKSQILNQTYPEQTEENFVAKVYGGSLRMAYQQALSELFGADIFDLYRDYCIAMSLLRNNDSIPSQYRTGYPYWTAQPDYPSAPQLSIVGGSTYAYWWSDMDTNLNPSPSAQAGGDYDTTIPQLGNGEDFEIEFQDLSSWTYVVDPSITTVTVKNTLGNINVTMHQFDKNVPDINGTFTVDGPHNIPLNGDQVFDVTSFTGTGLIRLVVTNLSLTDFGGVNNILQNPAVDRITGKAQITSV